MFPRMFPLSRRAPSTDASLVKAGFVPIFAVLVSFVGATMAAAVPAPASFVADDATPCGAIRLTWSEVPTATSYLLIVRAR